MRAAEGAGAARPIQIHNLRGQAPRSLRCEKRPRGEEDAMEGETPSQAIPNYTFDLRSPPGGHLWGPG